MAGRSVAGPQTASGGAGAAPASYSLEEQQDIEHALSVLPRTIRPLPKRQRTLVARQDSSVARSDRSNVDASSSPNSNKAVNSTRTHDRDIVEPWNRLNDHDEHEYMTTNAKDYHDKANERLSPTVEYRPATRHHNVPLVDSGQTDYEGSVKVEKVDPIHAQHDSFAHSVNAQAISSTAQLVQNTSIDTNEDQSTTRTATSHDAAFSSPPTSPASESQDKSSPDYFPLFGQPGNEIKRALNKASIFSKAGLFGALGLAALHPTLENANVGEDGHEGDNHVHHRHHEGSFDDDDDAEDELRGRGPEHRLVNVPTSPATSIPLGGSNKKKRKIPGVVRSVSRLDDEDDPYGDDAEEQGISPSSRQFEADDRPLVVPKVPADTPRTAKAALAKLALPPVHVSISPLATSFRKQRRKRFKFNEKLLEPLKLSPLSTVHIPESYLKDPAISPASTGLKGSRAVKAALKLEKEREREKQRVRAAIGADKLKLPNLYDPTGRLKRHRPPIDWPLPEKLRSEKDRANLAKACVVRDGSFDFEEPSPECIHIRWTALVDQMQHLALAKERAAKAREEERERRLEKERESAAAAASATYQPAPAAPTKSTTPAHLKPSNSKSTANASSAPTQASVPVDIPAAKKGSSKKGKKKRSAYANANNVHHRINYVPSRVPSSGGGAGASASPDAGNSHTPRAQTASDGMLYSWPASEEAIAAATRPDGSLPRLIGDDEWLCSFCDYELFFGEPPLFQRAIARRKKVLKVRKKAQERAAKLGTEKSSGATTSAAATTASESKGPA